MIKNYDRVTASEYAKKWALSRNPEFGDFHDIGGDCTNFISQCLLAGGGVMNYEYVKGWFYQSMTKRSPSWTSVAYLQRFLLRKEESMGPFGIIVPLNKIEVGDLLQLRQNKSHFNHTLIVSAILNGEIYVCAHTNDALDRPLKDYQYFAIQPIHIVGVRV